MGNNNSNNNSDLNNTLYKLLTLHFSCDTEEDEIFLIYLKTNLSIHSKNAEKHKDSYFNKNSQVLKTNTIIKTIKNWSLSTKNILISSNLLSLIIASVSGFAIFKNVNNKLIIILIAIILLILLSFNYTISNQNLKSKELLLKRHCETWIRHKCSYERLNIEIMSYVNCVGKYSNKNSNDAKKLFKATILDLYKQNIDTFEKNMYGTDESIQ